MFDMLKLILTMTIFVIFATVSFLGICAMFTHVAYKIYYIIIKAWSRHIKNNNDELYKLKDEISELKKALEQKTTRFKREKSKDLIDKEVELDILLRPFNIPSEGEKFYFYNDENKKIEFKSLKDRMYFESKLKNTIFDILELSDKEFFNFLKENIGLNKIKLLITPKTLYEYLQDQSGINYFIPRNIVSQVYADVVVYYEYLTKTYYIYIPVKK